MYTEFLLQDRLVYVFYTCALPDFFSGRILLYISKQLMMLFFRYVN